MPQQTEPSANIALGGLIEGMLARTDVFSESTQAIVGHAGLQPDVLVIRLGAAPVVVEAEFEPAAKVEDEAKARLGLQASPNGRVIEAVVALRYPEDVRQAHDLRAALESARLSYCVFTEETGGASRFPASGWLEGSVEDLADMVRLVSVPQRAVDAATDALQKGIDRVAAMLDEMEESRPNINPTIAQLLGMTNVPQTRRMACAIIVNAMVFHDRIVGMHPGIKPLALVCGPGVSNPQAETFQAWTNILEINYWPIFSIATDILNQLPSDYASQVLRTLHYTVGELAATGVDNAHDLTGRIFQKLIADRKYLATFYTLPASAALLARLAVAKMEGMDWSDAEAIGRLRVGDFACGTGALLSAVYEQIATRHERSGGDPAKLHMVMMEKVLYGCDVMPSAVHITSSTLAGAQPQVRYDESGFYPLAYGRQRDLSVKVGSLELLNSESAMSLYNTSDPARRTGSIGEETASLVEVEIPHDSFDMIIMNPPFTSNTKHLDADEGVLNAAFAAFESTEDDQKAMSSRMKSLVAGTCYHGHAGLASAFAALASRKLRSNGILAMVLPLTAVSGSSWAKFRKMIASQFTDVTIVSIAANGYDMSFSSDTGMAECLVIGRKIGRDEKSKGKSRATFISLRSRPRSFVDAQEFSRVVLSSSSPRTLEDGPYGGLLLHYGDAVAGEALDAPLDSHKVGWGAARILDASIAQAVHSLSNGKLWLPAEPQPAALPIVKLSQVGQRGLDHQFFVSRAHKAPFTKIGASPTATYPALWSHDAEKETRMVCLPDSQFLVIQGMEARASDLWATASRSHLTLDFRFTSQPLAVALTEPRSIGGRAWPNVTFDDDRFDYAFSIWANSTLGFLCFWWHSNRQQSGRGNITMTGIETLPILDFRALTDAQLAKAEETFDEFRDKDLKPAYLADADANRALLDRRVVCDLLGFDEATYEGVRRLAAKWCAEPSVHGGKARPKGSALVL